MPRKLTESVPAHLLYLASWEASDNPNDPSGVARFKVGHQSVIVAMRSFAQAAKLDALIQKACDLNKQQVIDRAIAGIPDLLSKYRYE